MSDYPKTMQRGVLKGQYFETASEYQIALEKAKEDGLIAPRKRSTKPGQATANGVTRAMADSLLSYVNVVLSVIPQTRDDLLEDGEKAALALGIMETARANKYFANLIVKSCRLQAGSRLGAAVGCVVARRIVKRERFPIPDQTRIAVEFGAVALLNVLADEGSIAVIEPDTEAETFTVPVSLEPNGHSDVEPGAFVDPFHVATG